MNPFTSKPTVTVTIDICTYSIIYHIISLYTKNILRTTKDILSMYLKIKTARYLIILPTNQNKYYCKNIVSGKECIINEEKFKIIEYLRIGRTYDNIKEKFKLIKQNVLKNILNELIKNDILISKENSEMDSFKEKFIIVGKGIDEPNDLSLEAYTIIKNCSTVVSYFGDDHTGNFLRNINPNIISLEDFFNKNIEKSNIHYLMAKIYIDIASKNKNVIFVLEGNPGVGEDIELKILSIAKEMKLTVKIVPGQSSLDSIFTKVNLNSLENGLTISEPWNLKKALHSDFPILITLIGYSRGTKTNNYVNFNQILKKEIAEIKKILLKKFSPDHTVYLLNPKGTFRLQLEKIEEFTKNWVRRKSTVYIPV